MVTTKIAALEQIKNLEEQRYALCGIDVRNPNWSKVRRIDRQIRDIAIEALGWDKEDLTSKESRYVATTGELVLLIKDI